MGSQTHEDSTVQEPVIHIDLHHDTASVFLTVLIP
jgi:hypothetical protein